MVDATFVLFTNAWPLGETVPLKPPAAHPLNLHIDCVCFPACSWVQSGHGALWRSALLQLLTHQQLLLCCSHWFITFLLRLYHTDNMTFLSDYFKDWHNKFAQTFMFPRCRILMRLVIPVLPTLARFVHFEDTLHQYLNVNSCLLKRVTNISQWMCTHVAAALWTDCVQRVGESWGVRSTTIISQAHEWAVDVCSSWPVTDLHCLSRKLCLLCLLIILL